MLIRFTVENFMSFKERQSFSLIPGQGRLKPLHKTKPVKRISTLKTSVIFGANASGKSNLIKAIDFGRTLVLEGTRSDKRIDFQNFRLDKEYQNKNSRIEYELQHKGKNYAYGFVFNSKEIVEEWLYEITKTSDKKLFERNLNSDEIFDLDFLYSKNKKAEERQFLKFTAKGTPNNQLFLKEIRTRKVEENVSFIDDLLNVVDWFQNSLKIIFPDDKYKEGIKFELKEYENLLTIFQEFLKYFDTGIDGVSLEVVDFENIDIPHVILNKIKEDLLDKKTDDFRVTIMSNKKTTYFISKKEDSVVYHKFMTKHKVPNGEDVFFDISDESDGTNRIIDYIPLLMDLLKGGNVFILDEMERSLHPNLIYDLIDLFLSNSQNINSQLILASHESSLLTQKLLRKDEVWFTVKDKDGSTKIHSLEEYNIRFDKQIRKDYLLGRFKAIPRIGNRNKLTVLQHQD